MSTIAHDVAAPTGNDQSYAVVIPTHNRIRRHAKQLYSECLHEVYIHTRRPISGAYEFFKVGTHLYLVFLRDWKSDLRKAGGTLTRSGAAKLLAAEFYEHKHTSMVIDDLHQTLLQQEDFAAQASADEGWTISQGSRIVRLEGAGVFATDAQALAYVEQRAYELSLRHVEASAFHTFYGLKDPSI